MYQTVHTSNALVGTCKMGPKGDNLSVVGGDLRVHGLKGNTNKIKPFLAFCDIAVFSEYHSNSSLRGNSCSCSWANYRYMK